jgi:hypothetical protein
MFASAVPGSRYGWNALTLLIGRINSLKCVHKSETIKKGGIGRKQDGGAVGGDFRRRAFPHQGRRVVRRSRKPQHPGPKSIFDGSTQSYENPHKPQGLCSLTTGLRKNPGK